LHRCHGYHDIRWGDQLSSFHRAWTPCAGLASDDVINPASQLIHFPLRLNRELRQRGVAVRRHGHPYLGHREGVHDTIRRTEVVPQTAHAEYVEPPGVDDRCI
jgi:hypothetical protein